MTGVPYALSYIFVIILNIPYCIAAAGRGSISGAPKKKTVEIIKSVEREERGYYTGIAGIFDGKDLDSCVMIRFIEKNNNSFRYRSGCGITFLSELTSEYQEMIDKVYVPINRKHKDGQWKGNEYSCS